MRFSLQRFKESLIEGILMLSGTVTSIAVILIVVFLFSEGLSVFNKAPLDEGYKIVINERNTVNQIASESIMMIFDGKITNWSELGGSDQSIEKFTLDDIELYITEEQLGENYENLNYYIDSLISAKPGIIAYVNKKFHNDNAAGKVIPVEDVDAATLFASKHWLPTTEPTAQLGILPLILGTFWVSLGAIIFALPFGIASAIYMAEIAPSGLRTIIKPMIELLAAIPSVVYGFFGLVVVVPMVQELFNLRVGETALAGSIILGIMALPTIITISEDALKNTPSSLRAASLALGANKWQTIIKVVLPYSISGISAAVILGIGRAIGETMAVLMVCGNAALIPTSFLQPVRTIPATIAAELGEAPFGGLHFKVLFLLGCILFILTFITNSAVEFISIHHKKKSMQ